MGEAAAPLSPERRAERERRGVIIMVCCGMLFWSCERTVVNTGGIQAWGPRYRASRNEKRETWARESIAGAGRCASAYTYWPSRGMGLRRGWGHGRGWYELQFGLVLFSPRLLVWSLTLASEPHVHPSQPIQPQRNKAVAEGWGKLLFPSGVFWAFFGGGWRALERTSQVAMQQSLHAAASIAEILRIARPSPSLRSM